MAQTEQRCNNGHFYNPDKFSNCPHCGVRGIDIGPTKPVSQPTTPNAPKGGTVGASPGRETRTSPVGGSRGSSDHRATKGYFESRISPEGKQQHIDPIVGWLVCIDGPDKGRDFRIKAEKNFIGRSTEMDVCISGDSRISRDNHAIVAFEPRNVEFRLYTGDARGLVYLNGHMVDVPTVLKPYDEIELGDSKLLFVPFCGERFKWSEK